MADQQLDTVDGEDGKLGEALSSFKKMVRVLVQETGLSTNQLTDMYGFGKGKVSTWQTAKTDQPNIPPLRFVEVLIKEAKERANLQDGAAAAFLRQYGELLKLYCARANPHNVHRQMLLDYQNTLSIRELNEATNAALEEIAGLTEELETLRGDRDEERRRRITLQRQIDSLRSQNQNRAAEKKTALNQRDQIRAGLAAYERDQQLEVWKPPAEPGGPHTHHPHEPAAVPSAPPSGRGTKRRLVLIAAGVLAVSLAVYGGTLLPGNQDDPKGSAGKGPGRTSTSTPTSPDRSPRTTASTGTSTTANPAQAAGGSADGGSSSNRGASSSTSGRASSGTSGGASSGASDDSNKVPSYFVGAWALTTQYPQYALQPAKVTISQAAPGEHAVRLISDTTGTGHCETVAKLVSVTDDGSRINIGSATVDQARSTQLCQPQDPSYFVISDPSGIQHNVGPSHGDGYHYDRAN